MECSEQRPAHEHSGTSSCSARSGLPSGPRGNLSEALLGQLHNGTNHEETGLIQISPGHSGGTGYHRSCQEEVPVIRSSQDQRKSQRSGRCLIEGLPSGRRVGVKSRRQAEDQVSVSQDGVGPNGHSFQCNTEPVCESLLSPTSSGGGCLVSELESVEGPLSIPSSLTSEQGPGKSSFLQRTNDSDHERSSPTVHSPSNPARDEEGVSPPPSSETTGEREVGGGWTSQVLSLDGVSLLRLHLQSKLGQELAEQIMKGKRDSTRYQNNVAWKSFQNFIRILTTDPPQGFEDIELESPSPSILLAFCLWLRRSKNFESSTIANYKASVGFVLERVFDINCSSWEFTAIKNSLFLEKPPNPPRVPEWDLQKVLDLLESDKYKTSSASLFNLLKKTIFLSTLAAGNRISEMAATVRNGLKKVDSSKKVRLPVKPGFLFKNQRMGRTPPPIELAPLGEGNSELCPVSTLRKYLEVTKLKTGPLFLNSKSGRPLLKSTLSKLICELIEEADPGSLPQAHDLRRTATSLAWARGLDPEEIAKRAFWRSSSIFIERYLSCRVSNKCVALNTV